MNPSADRRHAAALCSTFACPRTPARRMQRALGLLIAAAGLLIWLSGGFHG